MIHDTVRRPLPAPLPYSSRAGRGEIPAVDQAVQIDDLDHYDPTAPLMREDDLSLWLALGFIGFFIAVMTVVALAGGL